MSDRTVTQESPDSGSDWISATPEESLHPGQVVAARYRVVRQVGSGGMGAVFEVEHLALEQRCALKLLLPRHSHHRSTVRRFHREARAMARVQSVHVTKIMDFGNLESGLPYFVMELLSGEDLSEILRRESRLKVSRALKIALDATRGLGAVHDAGLVHRDIKPANLFITKDDTGTELCKLLDFGVIKSGLDTDTGPDRVVGTLRYMAPEQLSAGQADPRTDVYAISAVLYECVSGRPPHQSDRLERVLYAIMNENPRPLEECCSEVPKGLSDAVCRGLERDPKHRFGSARELASALQPFLATSRDTASIQDSTVGVALNVLRSGSRQRQRRLWKALSIVAASAASGGLAAFAVMDHAPRLSQKSPTASTVAPTTAAASAPRESAESPSVGSNGAAAIAARSPERVVDSRDDARRRQGPRGQAEPAATPKNDQRQTAMDVRRGYDRGGNSLNAVPKQPEPPDDSPLLRVGAETNPTSLDPQNPYAH